MSHPPQPTYHQYALRPAGYGPGGPGGYPPQGPPSQDPQRYYTPAPQGMSSAGPQASLAGSTADCHFPEPQYPASTPSPNFQRPGQGPGPGSTPAPFYVAGAEIPSHQAGGPPPPSGPQAGYPPRDHQATRLPSTGKAPAPINTSPPPPQQANPYAPYAPQQGGGGGGGPGRPQSTYGAQELATSVYDSPIASHHGPVGGAAANSANPNSAATYSSSVYSQDDPYNASPIVGTSNVNMPPPGQPGPSAPQPQYQSYHPPSLAPSANPYDAPAAPSQGPPPIPSGAAPQGGGRPPSTVMAPPPLQPGGAAYDARQTLPSQLGVGGPGAASGGQPQYKPYVPPPSTDGPSAPAPVDYYRQTGSLY